MYQVNVAETSKLLLSYSFKCIKRSGDVAVWLKDVVKGFTDGEAYPKVSIIIATIGRSSLRDTVKSVLEYNYPSYEVIVVLDLKRRGVAYARNRGLEIANSSLIHFIDDDAIAAKNNLIILVKAFLERKVRDRRIAGIQGAILPKASWGSRGVTTKIRLTMLGLKISTSNRSDLTDHVSTCNALFSSHALKIARGFDEQIHYQFDDVDLSFKLKSLGFNLYTTPKAKVIHLRELDRKSSYSPIRERALLRNVILLYWRWSPSNVWIYLIAVPTFCISRILQALLTFNKQNIKDSVYNFIEVLKTLRMLRSNYRHY